MRLLILLIGISLIACKSGNVDQDQTAESGQLEIQTEQAEPDHNLAKDEIVNSGDFPSCNYDKVIVYELSGKVGRGAKAVFSNQTGKEKELNKTELESFLDLLTSTESYGDFTASCHDPRIGLVFYMEEAPCAYISLCLACNNVYTEPKLDLDLQAGMENGFSKPSRGKLRSIFKDWGFPDENHSALFDE